MLRIASERLGDRAKLFVADMGEPLPMLGDDSFDLVVASLALDYVRDWSIPLAEFRRVLTSQGRLVISVQHPMGSYEWFKPETAFGVHYCEATWRGFTNEPVVVPDYYRSFEEIINPILTAGFSLQGLHETRPVAALKDINPRKYAQGMTQPTFMVIDARLA